MHHVQLKIELRADVVRALSERRIVEVGLERGGEQLRPGPTDVEAWSAESFEAQGWNAPLEHRLGHRFALQSVDLEPRHAEQLAVALDAAMGAAIDVVIVEAAEVEVRERIVARARGNRSARAQPDGGMVE